MKYLLVAALCVAGGVSSAAAGKAARGPVLSMTLGEYFSTVYATPAHAPADYVWWRPEPLVLRATVTNHGAEPVVVRVQPDSRNPFAISMAPIPAGDPQPARVNWYSLTTRRPTGSEQAATLPAALDSSSTLRWSGVTSDVSSLTPGIYRFTAQPSLVLSEASLRLLNDSVTIDLREPATDTDRLELLRVRATRCVREQQYACVASFSDAMLKLHPQAAFAYWLKGQSAAAKADVETAHRHFSRSLELLDSKADWIFTALNGEHRASEFAAGIRARMKQLQ